MSFLCKWLSMWIMALGVSALLGYAIGILIADLTTELDSFLNKVVVMAVTMTTMVFTAPRFMEMFQGD